MCHHLLHLDEWQYVTSVEYLDVETFQMKHTDVCMYIEEFILVEMHTSQSTNWN